jgi:predicted nucleotidyltransferase
VNHGLTDETTGQIRGVFSHYPEVEKAVLYGSRAKGSHRPGSDIDLALFGDKLDQTIIGRIDEELDDLLLPYRFDPSLFGTITHQELIEHIERVGVLFYERAAAGKAKG